MGDQKRSKNTDLQKRNQEIKIIFDNLKLHMTTYDERENGKAPVSKEHLKLKDQLTKLSKLEEFITEFMDDLSPLFRLHKNGHQNSESYSTNALGRSFLKTIQLSDVIQMLTQKKELTDFLPHTGSLSIHIEKLKASFSRRSISQSQAIFNTIRLYRGRESRVQDAEREEEWGRRNNDDLMLSVLKDFSKYNHKPQDDLEDEQKDSLNRLFKAFRSDINVVAFKKKVSTVRSNSNERYDACEEYIEDLFSVYRDLTFISLDLAFTDDYVGKDYQKELQSFFNGGRSQQSLKDRAGYIGKWEYSRIKGAYARVIFIFPTQKVSDVDTLTRLIGNYWKSILGGHGAYHRAKLAASKPFNRTHCEIKQKDDELRSSFNQAVLVYLAKVQNYYNPLGEQKEPAFPIVLIKGNKPKPTTSSQTDSSDDVRRGNPSEI